MLHALISGSYRPWVTLALFLALGWPLVRQDLESLSVSVPGLLAVSAVWLLWSMTSVDAPFRILASSVVILTGTLVMVLLPDRLGEADLVVAAGMATLLPFWPYLASITLACVAGVAAIAWASRRAAQAWAAPIPFLSCLYWGGATVLLGGFGG